MQSGGQPVTVGEILSSGFSALGRHASVCLLAGGLMAALFTLIDLTIGDRRGGGLITGVLSFVIQYHLLEYVLQRDFSVPVGARRYGSLFGAALLATLGGGLGLVLLIVPGLYLLARWSLSSVLVIGEGFTATDSLRESWQRTSGHVWPIVIFYLLFGLVLIGGAIALGVMIAVTGQAEGKEPFVVTLGGNVFGAAIGILSSLLSTALYGLIGKPTNTLNDVFG